MQSSTLISPSPSLNSYSSTRLAEIAVRVVEELRLEGDTDELEDDFVWDSEQHQQQEDEEIDVRNDAEEDEEDEEEEEEFEFAILSGESNFAPIPAEQIFYNGQIRPVYPVFGKDLISLHEDHDPKKTAGESPVARRLPLLKLFNEERETTSCSSSEADELDGIPPGTYCVWRPKAPESERCKKSSSTGTSKRWRFALDLNLLNRSNSDGTSKDRDAYVFMTPKKRSDCKVKKVKEAKEVAVKEEEGGGDGNGAERERKEGGGAAAAPMEARCYVKNKSKRKSFLPHRADLVGLFANVNGASKNSRTF